MWQVNQERRNEMLKIARERQLIQQSTIQQDKVEVMNRKNRLLVSVGELLIDVGSRVKARYEPATR
jgi:hypothetical protein